MTKTAHLDEWKALWERVLRLPTERESRVTWDRFARESFELVRVALLYQRNALGMYEDAPLHGLLRPSGSAEMTPVPWSAAEPLFPSIMSAPSPMLGGIFVASASFRLPVAVLKAMELSADPFERADVKLLEREGEWKRSVVSGFFSGVKKLACCNAGPLGGDEVGRLRNALVIALVHRDDFGHGEVGQPITEGTYKREREEVLDSLHVCRILQAQR